MHKKLLILTLLVLIPTCTTSHKMSDNQKSSGHFRLYTYPDKYKQTEFDSNRFKQVVLVSSNDFQGSVFPEVTPIPNRFKDKRNLTIGGVAAARAYLDIFQKYFSDKMLYVDSGSFLDLKKNHSQTMFLYNYLKVDVASLGLNEFLAHTPKNFAIKPYLDLLTQKASFDILASNLFDLTSGEQISFSGSKEFSIKEVNGLKIGFIGILTSNISEKIPDNKINGIYIQNPAKAVMTRATLLRRQGAHIVVLLANEGIDCTSQMAHAQDLPATKVNFNPEESKHCDTYKNDFYDLLEKLPSQTIDLAISSGKDSKVANHINGIPVMQNPGKGKYLSWVELFYDTKHNIVVPNMTQLHQPVMLCHNFFKSHQDCYKEGNIANEELSEARFLGEKVNIKDIPRSIPRLE